MSDRVNIQNSSMEFTYRSSRSSKCIGPLKKMVIWVFLLIMVPPKSSILIGVFHCKPSILGYPYIWKHPFGPKTLVVICVEPKKCVDPWPLAFGEDFRAISFLAKKIDPLLLVQICDAKTRLPTFFGVLEWNWIEIRSKKHGRLLATEVALSST